MNEQATQSAPEALEETNEAVETAAIEQVTAQAGSGEAKPAATRNRGKRWYIIHAYTGFERKVAQSILDEAAKQGISDLFEEVTVPSEEILEMRRGKKVMAERNMFPGYVMAKMEMTDATWQLVRTTDKVAGFLGGRGQRPLPISDAEASAIFAQVQQGTDAPKRTFSYEIGEQVKVSDGPFDGFIGTVEGYDDEREKLKVSVSIFGRPTPVELDYGQVQKA